MIFGWPRRSSTASKTTSYPGSKQRQRLVRARPSAPQTFSAIRSPKTSPPDSLACSGLALPIINVRPPRRPRPTRRPLAIESRSAETSTPVVATTQDSTRGLDHKGSGQECRVLTLPRITVRIRKTSCETTGMDHRLDGGGLGAQSGTTCARQTLDAGCVTVPIFALSAVKGGDCQCLAD
jgi:hypothetical protein